MVNNFDKAGKDRSAEIVVKLAGRNMAVKFNYLYFMNRVLIIGATGALGPERLNNSSIDFTVKCFVRNKQKASELEMAGAELIIGDLSNTAALKDICKNTDIVVTAADAMIGKGRNSSMKIDNKAHKTLIDDAVNAKVSHFIYTSIYGASPNHPIDFYRNKFSVEEYLIKSGLHYTIVRLPAFMEWHVYNFLGKPMLEKNKVVILGKGENPTNFIAIEDVVSALNIFAGNSKYFNTIINLAGPENVTRNAIAAAYAKKTAC